MRFISKAPYDGERKKRRREKGHYRICRWCGKDLPKRRSSWCSKPCADEYLVRISGSAVRRLLRKRDKAVCAICGLDVRRVERIIGVATYYVSEWTYAFRLARNPSLDAILAPAGYLARRTNWEADHIVPVSEGGGGCGLDNYRTLCRPCHIEETTKLRKRLSRKRNPSPQLVLAYEGSGPDL